MKRFITSKLLIATLLVTISISIPANAADNAPATNTQESKTQTADTSPDTSTTRMSQKGLYRVEYHSKVDPIPLNKIHSWTLHLETAKGQPVDNAKISVFGGMPAHKHGFPTAPKVTQALGNGDYLVEGLKFSMIGHWELWMTIRSGSQTDKAVINVILP